MDHQKTQLWANKEENEDPIRLILTNNDSKFAIMGGEGGGDEFITSTDLMRNTLILLQKRITLGICKMAGIML
jgi:hypothetical protein